MKNAPIQNANRGAGDKADCTSWKHRILAVIDLLMLVWIVLAMALFFGGNHHG